MNWLIIALSAYLLLAVANLLDKFLVDNVIKSSQAYAFVACLLGLLVMIIAPWFLVWPGVTWFLFDIFTGFIFSVALWSLYEALKRGEAAKTLVFIGGLTPIFSIIFSILFFKERYSFQQWLGMGFLLTGVLVIALLPQSRNFLERVVRKIGFTLQNKKAGLFIAFLSAFAYAIYFVATKYAYSQQPFLSVFLWNRLGAAIFVVLFLFNKKTRQAISKIFSKSKPTKNRGLVFLNQLLGSGGFILQNYAIYLGPVAIINALQGFQYAFLLAISALLALSSPRFFKESFSWKIVLQKSLAIILVMFGLYFVTVNIN